MARLQVTVKVIIFSLGTLGVLLKSTTCSPGPRDSFGRKFVFPVPYCYPGEFFKLQFRSRNLETAVVRIHTNKMRFTLVRGGNSLTSVFSCFGLLAPGTTSPGGCVEIVSSQDILVHVIHSADSFSVQPENTLGVEHMIFSATPEVEPSMANARIVHFVSIGVTAPKTNINFTSIEPQEIMLDGIVRNTSFTVTTERKDAILIESDFVPNGTLLVTADQPVIVVVGSYIFSRETNRQDSLLLTHLPPTSTAGKIYVQSWPKSCPSKVKVAVCKVAAEENSAKITIYDGSRKSLHSATTTGCFEHSGMGLISSATVVVQGDHPIHVILLMAMESCEENGRRSIHALTSLTPVEQYTANPCWTPPCRQTYQQSVVAGLEQDTSNLQKARQLFGFESVLTLSPFWMTVIRDQNSFILSPNLSLAKMNRLWFKDFAYVQFRDKLYLIDTGANHYPINADCRVMGIQDGGCGRLVALWTRRVFIENDPMDAMSEDTISNSIFKNCNNVVKIGVHWFRTPIPKESTGREKGIPDDPEKLVFMFSGFGILMVPVFICVAWLLDKRGR